MELADKDLQALKGMDASLRKLSVPPRKRSGSTPRQQHYKPCDRCGRSKHTTRDCRFADATYRYCHKKGHIAPACRKKKEAGNTKHIASGDYQDSNPEDFKLHAVQSKSSPPSMLNLKVEGRELPMELDTGAVFSVISESTYKAKFTKLPLHKSTISLQSYTNQHIPVVGQVNVHVRYGEQKAALVLLVVSGCGPALFGQNWLCYIRLDVDWRAVHAVQLGRKTPKLTDLVNQHEGFFAKGLGKIEPFRAMLRVRPDARPRSSNPDRYHSP